MAGYANTNDLLGLNDTSTPLISPNAFTSMDNSMSSTTRQSTAQFDAASSSPLSPIAFGKTTAPKSRQSSGQSDSFSSLAGLMRAKKSYAPVPPKTPKTVSAVVTDGSRFGSRQVSGSSVVLATTKPALSVVTNGSQFGSRDVSSSSIISPTPRPVLAVATNGLQFGSRQVSASSVLSPMPRPDLSGAKKVLQFTGHQDSASSILSPAAQPFVALESATAWVQEQEGGTNKPSRCVSDDLNARFDLLASQMSDCSIDEPIEQRPTTRSPIVSSSPPAVQLLSGFKTPPQIGPISPPTPADSTHVQHHVSAYDRSNAPVVRLTKEVWKSMNNGLSTLSKEKHDLEERLASAECDHQLLRDEGNDVSAQIGKLRYQNQANRDQKATMGRALSEKDIEIKIQQLEIVNLGKKIVGLEAEIHRFGKLVGNAEWLRATIKNNDAAYDRDLEAKTTALHQMESRLQQTELELESAKQAQAYAGDHAARAQNLSDVLSKREKAMSDLRFELLQEKDLVNILEDEIERLREQVDQENLDAVKAQLSKQRSECDRMRTQLKAVEQQHKTTQIRLDRALGGGEALRGGAHLVIPNEKSKLPKRVIACSECYAQNIPCDSGAKCRNCTQNNTQCARWRCSLKHKLGECPDHPCQLPHDPQGWLMTMEARPEW